MNKYLKTKMYICIFIIILAIFLFPIYKVYAETIKGYDGKEYTYSTEDDGSDGPDVTEIPFQVNTYGKDSLFITSAYLDINSFKVDEEHHGWRVYEKDGNNFVVLAAATHDFLSSCINGLFKGRFDTNKYPYTINFGRKYNHIHYFHTGEMIEFSFADKDFDSNNYFGVIFDSSYRATFPQDKEWKYKSDVNAIEIFFGPEAEKEGTDDYKRKTESKLDGKEIIVSMNGTYSPTADVKQRAKKKWNKMLITKALLFLGDWHESLIGMSFGNVRYIKPGVYTKDLVKTENAFKVTEIGETSDAKFLSEHDVSNVRKNRSGELEINYTKDSGIPIIQYDIYSMIAKNLDLFDINFINKESSNTNDCWRIIRNIVLAFSRSILYLSAAAIITILIWQGIKFVISIYKDSPMGAADAKSVLQNCAITIIRFIGIYIIIALNANLYYFVKGQILGEYTSSYLIRVNIKDVYSFNTNTIGGIRLMTMSTNLDQVHFWAWIYWGASILNLLYYALMFARMILVGFLTAIAPITAVTALFETDKNVEESKNIFDIREWFQFSGWIRILMLLVWVPMLVLILTRLLLRI